MRGHPYRHFKAHHHWHHWHSRHGCHGVEQGYKHPNPPAFCAEHRHRGPPSPHHGHPRCGPPPPHHGHHHGGPPPSYYRDHHNGFSSRSCEQNHSHRKGHGGRHMSHGHNHVHGPFKPMPPHGPCEGSGFCHGNPVNDFWHGCNIRENRHRSRCIQDSKDGNTGEQIFVVRGTFEERVRCKSI